MEAAVVGGCRRDCTTTVSHGVVSWERGYHAGIPPDFLLFHSPWDSTKTQKQKSVIFLLYLQGRFLAVCSWGQMQACQAYSLLLDPYGVHPPHRLAGNSHFGALLCFPFPSLSPVLPWDGWKVMRHLRCLSALHWWAPQAMQGAVLRSRVWTINFNRRENLKAICLEERLTASWKLPGCSGSKRLSIQHYQKLQSYSLDTHLFQIIESHSTDFCAFLC